MIHLLSFAMFAGLWIFILGVAVIVVRTIRRLERESSTAADGRCYPGL